MMAGGRPSHLGAAVRLAVAGVRRRGMPFGPRSSVPARKIAVERRNIMVHEPRVRRYLAATGGLSMYPQVAEDAVLPPTYTSVWETALTLELLALEGMPFPSRGVVHLASDVVVVRPLRRSDRIHCRLALERMETHARGTVLVLDGRCWNGAGQLCQQNETRLLVRGAVSPPGAKRAARSEGGIDSGFDQGEWSELTTWDLPAEAGLRYARASGDFNPIHLWPWSSRLLGFARPILHGHCLLAMIAHELSSVTGRRTSKAAARFRAPVELPGRVTLETAGELAAGAVSVRLVEGGRSCVEGRWVGGSFTAQDAEVIPPSRI